MRLHNAGFGDGDNFDYVRDQYEKVMKVYADADLADHELSHEEYDERKYKAQMKAAKIAFDYWDEDKGNQKHTIGKFQKP
jgi:hypothetical protein